MTDAQETTPALGWMAAREAAAGVIALSCWKHGGDDDFSRGMDAGAIHQTKQCVSAIRALPAPTPAQLLAEAMRLPEVAALVEWMRAKTRDIETYEMMYDDARADIFVGEILERLAAIKEAIHE